MANIGLQKGDHTYLFRYDPNNIDKLLIAIMEKVDDDTDFDWIDADAISHAVMAKEQL